jgi:hypothetical protein
MLGLMYLGAAALYLALMFFVVLWAWRIGRANGGSRLKGAGFGLVGFLVVYLPVFWNLVPTVLVHRHYCEKDAGFFVQMPADQWHATHESEVELINKLSRNLREATSPTTLLPGGSGRSTHFNGLLASDFKSERLSTWSVDLRRLTWRTVDARTGAVLATVVDYQTGPAPDMRFWVRRPSCFVRPPVGSGQERRALLPLDRLFAHDRTLRGEKR